MEEYPATPVGHSSGGILRVEIFHLAKLQEVVRLLPSQGNSVLGVDIRSVSGRTNFGEKRKGRKEILQRMVGCRSAVSFQILLNWAAR